MIKVGDVVEFYGSVGTVRRVLSDDSGSIAMVQWIGHNGANLKPIEVDLLSPSTKYRIVLEAGEVILKTIRELEKHPNIEWGLFNNISKEVESVLQSWKSYYGNKTD